MLRKNSNMGLIHAKGDRSHFFWLLLLFLKKWLQLLLLLLLRSSLEIYTPTSVYTPKAWKQSLFCHMR